MDQFTWNRLTLSEQQRMSAQQNCNYFMGSQLFVNRLSGMQDINASTETAYPVKNGNSMNKKLEAAKKWLKGREK